jgi:hypothetical protein
MSSFGLGGGGGESGANLDSLLAQLQRQSVPDQQPRQEQRPSASFQPHSYHGGETSQSYGGQQQSFDASQLLGSFNTNRGSPDLPAAPTPPSQSSMPPQTSFSGMANHFGAGTAPARATSDSRTNTLLNLLKFSDPASDSAPSQPPARSSFSGLPSQPGVIHAPSPTAADPTGILAAMMKGNLQADSSPAPAPKPEPATWTSSMPSADTQQYLLGLLNRPRPASEADPISATTLTPPSSSFGPEAQKTNMGALSSVPADQPSSTQLPRPSFDFDPKELGAKSPKFGSPSGQAALGASRPSPSHRARDKHTSSPHFQSSSKPTTPSKLGNAPIQILKKPEASTPILNNENKRPLSPGKSPDHQRRKLDLSSLPVNTTSAEGSGKKSVSAAINDLAAEVDEEARLAVARREQIEEQDDTTTEIVKELTQMDHAKSEADFEEHAQAAAQAIQRELSKTENREALEATLRPEVAQAVKDIVDEAANGSAAGKNDDTGKEGVADSWESEPDEIVVIEEPTADVKVYNFEMKPWISLTLKGDAEYERAKFHEDSIIGIARLKKDFDQMDRNLVTASEKFIAYAMVKAGVRIIRQEDGADAKVFSDTKDRIFSIAMSANTDPKQKAKETIIGTGVNGSVYWVQIRAGDKDLIDNSDWESRGFVLPPIGTQEGDSHGVLKTRARTSSQNPDFFGVGRGKIINIIFPHLILSRNIFQTGHPRLVDTDRLFQECSLRINTGKAGKDFAFSHDDTAIVSLDKSGHVKFWDVRKLTEHAARLDLPAQTSLEVKEPLMTLNTTVEGEKPWPTSVLLLDKQRPYQKGTALRYMIVGLKQNHTLQLWDLALGKPVQEFNLPHASETDAACSILYHSPTGMIVVGHPTRNSIYLLHLSAPKYTLKSFSQVEYIQRLVAQDSSIAQPSSTAVISGMRELSLEDLGVLRSLDILETPVNGPPAGDAAAQAHFELYAMHSKGVVCLVVKHGELGWDKNNKVVEPVDAQQAGLVKVRKLVQPQPVPLPIELPVSAASEAQKIKIALRPKERDTTKETPERSVMQKGQSSQGEESKSQARSSPLKTARENGELRELEDVMPQSVEKSEKKNRKKKDKANAGSNGAGPASGQVPSFNFSAAEFVPEAKNIAASADPGAPPVPYTMQSVEPLLAKHLNTLHGRLSSDITAHIAATVEALDRNLDKKLKDREASFETRQSKLLEMVSEVLNDNTQKVLTQIVREQFEKSVLPIIRDGINSTVTEQLGSRVGSSITHALQKELNRALPSTVAQSFARPEIAKNISDRVVSAVLDQVEDELLKAMNSQMIPAFTQLAAQAAQRAGNDVVRQVDENLARVEQRGLSDGNKIDQLIALNTKLSHTVSSIAASQTQLRDEVANLRQLVRQYENERGQPQAQSHERDPSLGLSQSQRNNAYPPSNLPPLSDMRQPYFASGGSDQYDPKRVGSNPFSTSSQVDAPSSSRQLAIGQTAVDNRPQIHQPQLPQPNAYPSVAQSSHSSSNSANELIATIAGKMREGLYQEAIVDWLRNDAYSEAVFRAVLSRYVPQSFAGQLSPLIWLSVLSMVSKDLGIGESGGGLNDQANPVTTKLMWIEVLLGAFGERVNSIVSPSASSSKHLFTLKSRQFADQIDTGTRDPRGDAQDHGRTEAAAGAALPGRQPRGAAGPCAQEHHGHDGAGQPHH